MKKKILMTLTICVVIPVLVWVGTLAKNLILTATYKDRIGNLQFAEYEEHLPEFDWYRITSYYNEKVEIYYVDGDVGGKITCRKTANGWTHTDMVDSILWSNSGSADEYVWPYWYHIFLAG